MSFGTAAASYTELNPWLDYSGIAPSYNQPTITTTAVGAGATTTIVGSAGWLREKRVGVAENIPGASQSSTNDLDIAHSTCFAYPGLASVAEADFGLYATKLSRRAPMRAATYS